MLTTSGLEEQRYWMEKLWLLQMWYVKFYYTPNEIILAEYLTEARLETCFVLFLLHEKEINGYLRSNEIYNLCIGERIVTGHMVAVFISLGGLMASVASLVL